MKVKFLLAMFIASAMSSISMADHIWVNEFHYDNVGADSGEFIEIGVRTPNLSGVPFSDYAVEFYDDDGTLRTTTTTLDEFDVINEFTVVNPNSADELITLYSLDVVLQNSTEGFAIVNDATGVVVPGSFYSYEGVITATEGSAIGLTSLDVGVVEGGTTPVGTSISAIGTGFGQDQFNNTSFATGVAATPGFRNAGQVFARPAAVPEPSSIALLGLIGCVGLGRRRRN